MSRKQPPLPSPSSGRWRWRRSRTSTRRTDLPGYVHSDSETTNKVMLKVLW